MKLNNFILSLILCLFFASCGKKPDLIYINAKIYTLDKNNSIAEAIAVRDGKILAVGKTQELTEKYSSAKTIDLKGKTVVPGFIDAEGNLMEFSRNLGFIDLRNAKSLDEILKLVKQKVSQTPEGEWIGGFGWDDLALPPAEFKRIDHRILDSISINHKIYLINSRADMVWVNKPTLDASYITKDTPDPQDGEIEKDKKNQPTGLLFGDAQLLVIQALPQPKEEEVIKNVQKGISELFKYGITGINDANLSEDNLKLYKKMVDMNKFPLRLYAMISGKGPLFDKYIASGPEEYKDKIFVKCMYLEYDGYFETQDAAMINDYLKEPKRKTPYNDEYDLREMMNAALRKDFQVAVKAVGDRAVNSALNAFDSAYRQVKPKSPRNRIEYAEFIQPSDLQRMKQFEIIPSIRPEISLEDKSVVSAIINPENSKNLGLWSTLLRQNGRIISGTDFPYHIIDPLMQIYFMTTGIGFDTTVSNAQQKISITDALKSFTSYIAYACYEEDVKGTLEPGKLADFVVLSEDIIASDPKVLLNSKVLMTVVRGEIVFESSGLPLFQ